MNLAKLGLTGLNAAQHRLQTSGHNINNADTEGYNRQSVLVATARPHATGAGYVGRGVQAVTIQRAYDGFLAGQLSAAKSRGASITAYGNEITQINNLFADRTVGISPALQKFFDGVQAVASAPADSAAREELLGRAASLVTQITDANAFLDDQRGNINTQITTVVTQINSYVERISDMNAQITKARATAVGHEPNDLLDQRDQLVDELGQLVGVKVIEQDGSFSLTVGNGQMLLGGDTVFPLHAMRSANDPERIVVGYSSPAGAGEMNQHEMDETRIQGGKLAGLLAYRRDALDAVQNDLGRLAVGLALSFNEQHVQGDHLVRVVDENGDVVSPNGEEFFGLGPIRAIPVGGTTATPPSVEFADANALTGQDYRLTRVDDGYEITQLPSGASLNVNDADIVDGVFVHDGLRINVGTAPTAPGETWTIQPTRQAAQNLTLLINDPARIAAAGPGTGSANGDNALELAKLQSKKLLGNGSMSLNEAFSQIVNQVGVLTQQNSTEAKAQVTLINQNYAAQQAVSGVNLNEEYVNIERYQEQFRAASKLIEVSATLFDTLLTMRA